MSVRYAYLATEGPHDVEFIARLLRLHGLKRITEEKRLDAYWKPLIPRSFPHGGDLHKRVPVPSFFASGTVSVAVHAAGGDSRIAEAIEETLALLPSRTLDAIGALLDADTQQTAAQRFLALQERLLALKLPLPGKPGSASQVSPRCGVFILPDNQSQGTLEDVLLECAAQTYPALLSEAQGLVGRIVPGGPEYQPEDMKDFLKPAGRNKAAVACMAGVLRPGKAVQVSIQDNRWLTGQALKLPRVVGVHDFLVSLLQLP